MLFPDFSVAAVPNLTTEMQTSVIDKVRTHYASNQAFLGEGLFPRVLLGVTPQDDGARDKTLGCSGQLQVCCNLSVFSFEQSAKMRLFSRTLLAVSLTDAIVSAGIEQAILPNGRQQCTVHANGNQTDDVPNILKAFATCGEGGDIVFPENEDYYIATRLNPTVNDVQIHWHGQWTFSPDLTYWRQNSYPIFFQNHAAGFVLSGDGIWINGYSTGGIFGNGNTWVRLLRLSVNTVECRQRAWGLRPTTTYFSANRCTVRRRSRLACRRHPARAAHALCLLERVRRVRVQLLHPRPSAVGHQHHEWDKHGVC